MGTILLRRSGERGHADHGWLDSWHTFSFADYHDPRWMGFRSLRVINDDVIQPGMGFGLHPHMEILTYILRGQLEHRDSMGNRRVIGAGDVQYMAAGTGIRHSEMNPSLDQAVHLLQIWIVPERRGLEPRYAERSMATAPGGRLHLVASHTGREDSLAIHQDVDLWFGRLEAGDQASHRLAPGRHAWLHVAEGSIRLGEERLGAGDAAAVTGAERLEIVALEPAQVLLFDLA